jgi:hypothetical protein
MSGTETTMIHNYSKETNKQKNKAKAVQNKIKVYFNQQ